MRKDLPKSARAKIGIGDGRAARRRRQPARTSQVQLVGDSTADAERARRRHRADPVARARSCATCASTPATSNSELQRARRPRARGRVRLQRAAGRAVRRHRPARRAAARVPPRRHRGAGLGALRRRRAVTAWRTWPAFTVRAPDGTHGAAAGDGATWRSTPRRIADPAHQPPDHADDQGQPAPTRRPCPKRARRSRTTLKAVAVPGRLQLHLRRRRVPATTTRRCSR